MQPTISNRSPWAVTVPRARHLSRQFPYTARRTAEALVAQLATEGISARLLQLETSFQVRVRRRGFPEQTGTFSTLQDAQEFAARVHADMTAGMSLDRSRPLHTPVSELVRRYIREECVKHKSGVSEAERLNKMLRDSGAAPEPFGGARPFGQSGRNKPKSVRCEAVHWLHKPLAKLGAEDIEDYIADRLESVSPSTVSREVDLICAVVNVALKTWRYDMPLHPLRGLRRPSFFNERSRRLLDGEEALLIELSAKCANPWVRPTIQLALETAMRRSELLQMRWSDLDVQARCITLRETKNGRTRRVPLTAAAMRLMESIPRTGERVLAISVEAFKTAWHRMVHESGPEHVLRHKLEDRLLQDLRFHDLRHEALSRLAESGAFSTSTDLQAVSGHRDPRMLLRYLTLSTTQLAERMDVALGHLPPSHYLHGGRLRIAGPLGELHSQVAPAQAFGAKAKSNVVLVDFRAARDAK